MQGVLGGVNPKPELPIRCRAAAGTYLVRPAVPLAIHYRLMDVELGWLPKLALSVALTMAICLLGWRLVRGTWLGRVLGAPDVRRNAMQPIAG